MNTLSYLLSILLLALIAVPCADTYQRTLTHSTAAVAVPDDHHHHNDNGYGDACSPFCVCHCCHAHILIKNTVPGTARFAAEPTFVNHVVICLPTPSFTIWQPPRS